MIGVNFSVIKNRDLRYCRHDANVVNCLPLLRSPQKDHDFHVFFAFYRKTREILANYFRYIIENDLDTFFSIFKGVNYNVPLEKLKKDQRG